MTFFKTLLLGGPVALVHALRLEYIQRRMVKVREQLDSEKDVHRETLRTLNYELVQLADKQQRVSVQAAIYWKSLS